MSTMFLLNHQDHPGSDLEMSQDNRYLGLVLDQIVQMLEILITMNADPIIGQELEPGQPILEGCFLTSIKQDVKPLIKPG